MKRFFILLSMVVAGSLCAADYERPFVVVVPSYNNAEWSVHTLETIFNQKYDNYRVIFIDDASTDGNADVVEKYITEHNLWHKFTLIRNKNRCRKLKNIYNAIHSCPDNVIIIQPDGDDWLAHDQVFADVNKAYASGDVWMTYGQYRNVPKEEAEKWGMKEIGYSAEPQEGVVENRSFRTTRWVYMQLRTFYAGLFKKIPLKDFLTDTVPGYVGKFYPAANDCAMMYPMLEMAHWRFRYLPDIAYIRNLYSPLVGFKIDRTLQRIAGKEIRQQPLYPVLKNAPIVNEYAYLAKQPVAVLLYAQGDWQKTARAVEYITRYADHVGRICIFSAEQPNDPSVRRAFADLNKKVTFFPQVSDVDSFKPALQAALFAAQHCVLATDEQILTDYVDFGACAHDLAATGSYAFYMSFDFEHGIFKRFDNGEPITPCQHLRGDLMAWKFTRTAAEWSAYNNFNYVMYSADEIRRFIERQKIASVQDFYEQWQRVDVDKNATGLFYKTVKVMSSRDVMAELEMLT